MLLFRTVVASTERIVNQMEDGLNKARGERLLKLFTRSMFYCGEVRLQADNRLLVSGISIAGSSLGRPQLFFGVFGKGGFVALF